MSRSVKIPDTVYRTADQLRENRDMTMKEAIREVFQEAGYEV